MILNKEARNLVGICYDTLESLLENSVSKAYMVDDKNVYGNMVFHAYGGDTYFFKGLMFDDLGYISLLGYKIESHNDVSPSGAPEKYGTGKVVDVKNHMYDHTQLLNIVRYIDEIENHSID